MATSMQDILAKARQKSNANNKQRLSKPPAGKSTWRILPGWNPKEPNMFFHPYGQHYVKDLEGNIKAVLVCPDKTFDKPCEVCEMISAAMKNAPDDETRNKISESRANQQFIMNAVRVDNPDGKVHILGVGSMLFNAIIESLEEYEDMLDPNEGNDLIIQREGTGLNTKYTLTPRAASKSKPVDASLLQQMHDLDVYCEEDFEAKKERALEALSGVTGILPPTSGAAGALTGPSKTAVDIDDDEIPDYSDEEEKKPAKSAKADIEDAELVDEDDGAADAASGGEEDMSDDELDALLDDI